MATIIDSGVLIAANWNHLNYDNISTRHEKEDVAINRRSEPLTGPCMTKWAKTQNPRRWDEHADKWHH